LDGKVDNVAWKEVFWGLPSHFEVVTIFGNQKNGPFGRLVDGRVVYEIDIGQWIGLRENLNRKAPYFIIFHGKIDGLR
jgi:hypothetical protein